MEEIQRRGKAIIHSTKEYGDLSEIDVRTFFADLRNTETRTTGAPR